MIHYRGSIKKRVVVVSCRADVRMLTERFEKLSFVHDENAIGNASWESDSLVINYEPISSPNADERTVANGILFNHVPYGKLPSKSTTNKQREVQNKPMRIMFGALIAIAAIFYSLWGDLSSSAFEELCNKQLLIGFAENQTQLYEMQFQHLMESESTVAGDSGNITLLTGLTKPGTSTDFGNILGLSGGSTTSNFRGW